MPANGTANIKARPSPGMDGLAPNLPSAGTGSRPLAAVHEWRLCGNSPDPADTGSHPIERTAHAPSPFVEYVGVDHGRSHVGMTQELLHGSDVVPGLQQVSRERVTQHVRRARLVDSRASRGCIHCPPQRLLMQVIPEDFS